MTGFDVVSGEEANWKQLVDGAPYQVHELGLLEIIGTLSPTSVLMKI